MRSKEGEGEGEREMEKKCEFYDGHCHSAQRKAFNIFIVSFGCIHSKSSSSSPSFAGNTETPNVIMRRDAMQRKNETDALSNRRSYGGNTQITRRRALYFCTISMLLHSTRSFLRLFFSACCFYFPSSSAFFSFELLQYLLQFS